MDTNGGKLLFEEKICSAKNSFEELSPEGFQFITQLFSLVNENDQLISVNRIKLSKSKSYTSYSNVDNPRYGKYSFNKKPKDTLDEIVLKVHPSKLRGTEIFWRIMQNNNNRDVIERARDFLNKLYTNLSSELEDQALEIRGAFIETYLEKLSGLVDSTKNKGQMVSRMVSLMMDMIDESERKGTGSLRSHSALLRGQLLEFTVENNVTSGNTVPKKFPVEVYANTTIWELKTELGKYVESSPVCMKIAVDNEELKDNDNGKMVGEFISKRVGVIRLEKNNMDDIPKVALLTEEREMTEKVKAALKDVFEKFAKDGRMDADAAALFTQNTTGESLVTKSDNRIKMLMSSFGKEGGSYIDLEGFYNFYKDAIVNNREDVVRKNLAVYGYRNDLKRLNEVEEAVVDVKTLPRYILSCNPKSFELLFQILDRGDAHSGEQTWNLVSRLSTNEAVHKRLAELQVPSEQKQPMWEKLIDVHSKYRLLYSLQIIESFLENDDVDAELKRDEWQKKFVAKGGFEFLLSIFLNQDKDKGVCFAFSKEMDKFEKECLGFIGKILNVFIRSAVYALDEKLLQEVKNIQGKLVEEPEVKVEETKSKETESEKDTAKKTQVDLKELFKAKPSKIVFLKTSDSLRSITREIGNMEMDREVARHIIEEAKPNEIWTRQIDLLSSIVYSGNVTFFDNIIVTAALELFTSCVLISNKIFTLAKDYNKHAVSFEQILIKGLSCEESQIIREKFAYIMGFLCYIMKDSDTLEYTLNILLSNMPNKSSAAARNCGEYFALMSKLIDIHYESASKSTAIDPRKCLPEFVEMLKKHRSLEKHSALAEDKLLVGLLEIVRKILLHEPEMKEDVSISGGLLHEVFFNCLFPKHCSTAGDTPVTGEGETADTQKCKSAQSRSAAYKLLSAMCSDNLKGQLHFVKDCLEPLCASIKPHSGWAYVPSSESRSKLGYAGLENLGCICYMLAMIQQFYMIPTFRYKLMAADDKRAPMIENPKKVDDNILHQLQRIFAYLELTERQDFKPDKFCFAFKDLDGQPTNISIQQDAQEFLNLIFDRLENLLACTPEKYLLQNVFGGKTCSQIICKGGCGDVRRNYEDFYNLSLGVKGNTTLFEALDNLIASDTINEFNCEHCARKVSVLKRTCLSQLPNILVVHLQRLLFNYDTMMNEKINSRLEFPKEFSLEPYTVEGVEAREKAGNAKNLPEDYYLHGHDPAHYEYKLVGVVVHYGTADAGHYYSYINTNRKRKLRSDG